MYKYANFQLNSQLNIWWDKVESMKRGELGLWPPRINTDLHVTWTICHFWSSICIEWSRTRTSSFGWDPSPCLPSSLEDCVSTSPDFSHAEYKLKSQVGFEVPSLHQPSGFLLLSFSSRSHCFWRGAQQQPLGTYLPARDSSKGRSLLWSCIWASCCTQAPSMRPMFGSSKLEIFFQVGCGLVKSLTMIDGSRDAKRRQKEQKIRQHLSYKTILILSSHFLFSVSPLVTMCDILCARME